ncbi:MAG: RodZ domain-containing protein [Pseudomonadales bacterium]
MNEANDPQVEKQAYAESAGDRLRHEREAQKIPEKEAAHKLHLMVTDLRAIEADNYNASANDDLLRNYLRDYANLLTLNPDSILAIYDRQAGTSFHRGAQRVGDIPKAPTTNIGSLLTGSLVATTVVLGFLVILQFTNTSKVNALLAEYDNRLDVDLQQTNDIVTNPSPGDDLDLTPATVGEERDVALAAADMNPATTNEAESRAKTVDETVERSADAALPVRAAAEPQPTVKKTDDDSNSVTEVAAAYRNADAAAQSTTATDELSFRFAKDCWVEVYDADEKRLIAELRKAGGSLQVSGKSPFKVLVGLSREVVLQFNGHPVEIEKIERSFSTLFRVERANSDADAPTVTTIRRKTVESPTSKAAVE